jgi:hypothetical protein
LFGILSGASVVNDADIADLVGFFLSAFGVGFTIGYILRVFIRAAEYTR